MKPEHRRILYIVLVVSLVVIAIVLGLVFGLRKSDDKGNGPTDEDKVDVLNLYNNTAELIKKYPVINNTTVLPGLEERIQNRLLTGFENWNRGFKTWKAWGNILYTNDSIYNVHGARLSLAHYQDAMDVSLKQANIIMGDFHNMLISDNYTAIHYDFITEVGQYRKKGKVMEFVRFMDYGEELGTRVVEGWGSTKDTSYDGLIHYQGEDEKRVQEEQDNDNLGYQIKNTDNLTEKYIIKYPTEYIDENADDILDIMRKGFDAWNKGISYYKNWVDENFDINANSSSLDERERNMTLYKQEITELFENYTITKLYFDNVLIRDNWAALHYRYRRADKKNTNVYVGDRMEFYKLEQKENRLKIVATWVQ